MAVRALYIHVPFCASKCRYCDFDSRPCHDVGQLAAYADALCACVDWLGAADALAACETAYIGGGTPSLLGESLVRIVGCVRTWAPQVRELTCEANPESMDGRLAHDLARGGATRVSLGVQSFNDDELAALGRIHDAARARSAIAAALDAGLAVSCDLMCGIPLQTEDSWRASVDAAVLCGVGHVSVYPLTIEEGTRFAALVDAGKLDEPDADFQAWCMEEARCRLAGSGFAPYEVASYALPGRACAHNIAYWTGVPYLGLGRSAASMLDRATYDELRDLLQAPAVARPDTARVRFVQTSDALPGDGPDLELECMSAREAASEDLMLGMRMTAGVDETLLVRAAEEVGRTRLDAALVEAVGRGLARWTDGQDGRRLVPTHDGWLLGNELYGLFWDLASD